MEIPIPKSNTPDIYSYNFDKQLYRVPLYKEITKESSPVVYNQFEQMSSTLLSSGNLSGVFNLVSGDIQSGNFVTGSAGWKINYDGDVEFGSGEFRGTITATAGAIGGWNIAATTLTATSIILDSGNERISVGASNPILIDGANKKIESGNYVSGVAGAGFHLSEDLLEVANISARGLIRTACFQKDVISSIGGNFMVIDSDVLNADMTVADNSTVTTKATTTFSVGDILRIKDGTDDEWLEVTAVNGAVYTCNRDKKGDYGADANPAWKKGATVVNYGQSGDGGIFMTASESNAPYLSVFTHAGSPWSDLNTRLRIGNLNGYLGYTTDLYGIGIGDATHYLKYDPTNGLTIEGSKIKTSASGERMEMGISVGGNVHNLMKYDADSNIPVMLGGVGVNAEVAFRNYTATHITAIIEQTVAAAVGLYVDMGASATKAGISFSNVGSGHDIEGSSDKWHISKLGASYFDAEMDLNTHKIVNVTDPTANQDAATKKYHDDNPSKQTIIENATAGEALAAWDALLISDGTETYDVSYLSADTYRDMVSPTTWYGQVFKTHVCGGKITKATLKLYKQGTPTGTITCSIRAVSGSHPTGSDLVTKTLNAADMPAGSTEVDFEFASPLAITGNTRYAVLLTSSDASGSHFIRASRKSGNNYTDGDEQVGSGESWNTYNYDWYFKVTQILTAGKVYKSEGSKDTSQDHYIGFTENAVNKDATFDVVAGGVTAKTGLTVGKVYQLKSAAGNRGEIEILATPTEPHKRVGIAIKESSTVKLLVLNSYNTH